MSSNEKAPALREQSEGQKNQLGGGSNPTVAQPSHGGASRLPRVRDELSPRARPVVAAPGWPVRIPGRPGWWRQSINGQQVDVPPRGPSGQ